MNRRALLAGFAGTSIAAVSMPLLAQAATGRTIDADKLPALMGGDFATATSRLAARHSKNRMIRTFAELEIEEQAAVAKAFGARPGQAGMRRDQAAMVAQLDALRGPAFDRMYLQGQMKGHRELLRIHRRYAASGSDPEARGAAIVGVTSIKSHIAILEAIEAARG